MTLQSLQAGRAFAAIAVVAYHVSIIFGQAEYGGTDIFSGASQFGILGVNYFFILSGFIILMAHFDDLGTPQRVGRYAWRRAIRIYPIYWIYLLLYLAASASGFGHPDFSWSGDQLANAFLLFEAFPATSPLPLKVAWTLFYEVQFYLIFVTLLVYLPVGLVVFSAWTIAILINFLFPFSDSTVLSIWNIHFLLGMFAYLAFRMLSPRWSLPILAAGLLGIGSFILGQLGAEASIKELRGSEMPVLALGFALVVLGLTLAEKGGKLPVAPVVRYLGDASYSIYLVHSAVISVAAAILARLNVLAPSTAALWYFATLVAATVAGCIGYSLIEKPLLDRLRGLSRKAPAIPGIAEERP